MAKNDYTKYEDAPRIERIPAKRKFQGDDSQKLSGKNKKRRDVSHREFSMAR